MVDKRLEEYREYYAARVERYKNNPNLQHSFEAESRLNEVVQKYDTFEEIKNHLGTLNIDCAFALWRDQYEMESKYYDSVAEPIRKKAADSILTELSVNNDITSMSSKINEITNQNSIEIYLDECDGQSMNWEKIDEIDIYENAEVPDKYKADMQEHADNLRARLCERVKTLETDNQQWQNGWRLNPNAILEQRYRELLPYTDDMVHEHLAKYKKIVNR